MFYRLLVCLRWLRITFHRYGVVGVVRGSRSRHASYGRGVRDTIHGGAHRMWGMVGDNVPSTDLVRRLQLERAG